MQLHPWGGWPEIYVKHEEELRLDTAWEHCSIVACIMKSEEYKSQEKSSLACVRISQIIQGQRTDRFPSLSGGVHLKHVVIQKVSKTLL